MQCLLCLCASFQIEMINIISMLILMIYSLISVDGKYHLIAFAHNYYYRLLAAMKSEMSAVDNSFILHEIMSQIDY